MDVSEHSPYPAPFPTSSLPTRRTHNVRFREKYAAHLIEVRLQSCQVFGTETRRKTLQTRYVDVPYNCLIFEGGRRESSSDSSKTRLTRQHLRYRVRSRCDDSLNVASSSPIDSNVMGKSRLRPSLARNPSYLQTCTCGKPKLP